MTGQSGSLRMLIRGKRFNIDVAPLAFGENPIDIQDKMTSSDILCAAECLGAKVMIPLHWYAWTNTRGVSHEDC